MREIKFRAFHKEDKKMCDVDIVNFDEGAFLIGVAPNENQILPNLRLTVISPKSGRFCNFNEFELMQYTELKDKNGKEIYESDRVKSLNFNFIVKWNNAGFQLFNEENKKRFWALTETSAKSIEVIGNIYENQEALK